MEEQRKETAQELQDRFHDYLYEVAYRLRDEGNIHTWHIIDIPTDMFPNGVVIMEDVVTFENTESSSLRKVLGGKTTVALGGFKFLIRHPHHRA